METYRILLLHLAIFASVGAVMLAGHLLGVVLRAIRLAFRDIQQCRLAGRQHTSCTTFRYPAFRVARRL